MMLPITLKAPSSLPVMTMPATLPLIALRPVALYSSSSASSRSIRRCMRLERPPDGKYPGSRTPQAHLLQRIGEHRMLSDKNEMNKRLIKLAESPMSRFWHLEYDVLSTPERVFRT